MSSSSYSAQATSLYEQSKIYQPKATFIMGHKIKELESEMSAELRVNIENLQDKNKSDKM